MAAVVFLQKLLLQPPRPAGVAFPDVDVPIRRVEEGLDDLRQMFDKARAIQHDLIVQAAHAIFDSASTPRT